jgi:hypothetical protein
MNLPINNLKRDEFYTFLHGVAIASIWLLFFNKTESITNLLFIASWLFSTAFLWIMYIFLSTAVSKLVAKRLENKSIDDLLKIHHVNKLSLFYTGPIEERSINSHILGLLATTLLIAYYPIISLLNIRLSFFWFFHSCYTIITIYVLYEYALNIYYLASVIRTVSKGGCDFINEKVYAQKRAELFAELKHDEYKETMKNKEPITNQSS